MTVAAKSREVRKKKDPPRRSTSSRSAAKASEMGKGIEDVTDLMTTAVVKQIADVESVIGQIDRMTEAKLAENIEGWASLAAEFSRQAVHAGASALVYAWACGKLLNEAKENLGHGGFGKWRKEHVESAGVSERTSTRYMKLAESCADVRGLLQWAPTLRQAYVGCGVLPPPQERDKDEPEGESSEEERHEKDVRRKKEVLLASVSALQQRLHQGIGIKENLDASEVRQIKLARVQIDSFFDQILGKRS